MKFSRLLLVTIVFGLFLLSSAGRAWSSTAKVTQFASAFNHPRGLKFGRTDFYMSRKAGPAARRPPQKRIVLRWWFPVGPYSGGFTARISRVDRHGSRQTIIDGLPSSQTSPALGSFVSGVA